MQKKTIKSRHESNKIEKNAHEMAIKKFVSGFVFLCPLNGLQYRTAATSFIFMVPAAQVKTVQIGGEVIERMKFHKMQTTTKGKRNDEKGRRVRFSLVWTTI